MTYLTIAIRCLCAWLGPRSQPYDLVRVYALSMMIGLFYLFFGNLGIETGATHYMQWADVIVSGHSIKGNTAFYIRDVGMALIVLISGFPWTQSLTSLVLIQVAMGITMPLFTYAMLRPWFPRTAYYTAIASTLLLGPFLLAKTIHHDQPYVFLLIVSLWLLSLFVRRNRPVDLYILTITVFALSLVRQVGKGLYPLLMIIALLESPRRYLKHIAACVVIFVACNYGYSNYRTAVLGNLPALGVEAFENIYLNSSEFGVKLSPEFGPNMKIVVDRARECALPTPAEAPKLKNGPSAAWFMAEHFYKYTADELVEKVFTQTHREYLYYLLGCVADDHATLDHVMLMAALETAKARPLYVLSYAFRNSFQLLFDPGWLNGRHTTEPHFRGGLLFPYGGISTGGRSTLGDRLPEPAMSEAGFIPLTRQPKFVQELYFEIELAWLRSYHTITIIVGCLMVLTWISTLIGLLQRMFKSSPVLKRWSDRWLSHLVVPSSLGISAMLLANVGISGLFIDSYYRYDFSLLLMKFMLAGIGAAIILHFLKPILAFTPFRRAMAAESAGPDLAAGGWGVAQVGYRISARDWANGLGIAAAILCGVALLIYVFWYADTQSQTSQRLVKSTPTTAATSLPAATTPVASQAAAAPAQVATPTAPPSAPQAALLPPGIKPTKLADLPARSAGQQWDLIWGLSATPLQTRSVVGGQTVLQLVAVPTDERHAVAVRFRETSSPSSEYRFTIWVKGDPGVNVQIMVRDTIDPKTGTAGLERVFRFDLAELSVLSTSEGGATPSIERGTDDWRKIHVDLPTVDKQVYVYVGVLEVGSNKHVFRGSGERLTLGGIEIARR